VAATLYKARGVPTKQEVCAICVERTRGKTVNLHLGRGVSVWLCAQHGSLEFQKSRSGRDFVLTLSRLWSAHGCLTAQRRMALRDHLDANRSAPPTPRRRPGSYSWPALRREAEALFRQGAPPASVIRELRRRHEKDYATVPSIRTMRRWYTDRRWMTLPPPVGAVRGSGDQADSTPAAATRSIGRASGGHLDVSRSDPRTLPVQHSPSVPPSTAPPHPPPHAQPSAPPHPPPSAEGRPREQPDRPRPP